MATFGNTSIYGATGQLSQNILGAGPVTATAGDIASISAYLNSNNAARKARFALYKASDDSLVAQTNEITLPTGAQWHTANFASPVTLSADNYYILAWADGSFAVTIAREAASGSGRFRGLSYTGTFPDPSGTANNNFRYSIYATYVEEEPPVESNIKRYTGSEWVSVTRHTIS